MANDDWHDDMPQHIRDAIFLAAFGRDPTEKEQVELSTASNATEFFYRISSRSQFYKTALFHSAATALEQRRVKSERSRVQTDISAAMLAKLFSMTERSWERLGEDEPHWSVVTAPQFRSDVIEANVDKFYVSGEGEVNNLLSSLCRAGIEPRSLSRVLEIGCGVGRLTEHLARHFDHVTGVDISQQHLDLAKERMNSQGLANVDFVKVHSPNDYAKFKGYDCIYSFIVLQHSSPPIIKDMLRKLLSNANPGAVCYVQVPSHIEGYRFDAEAYIDKGHEGMEMHCLPQQEMFDVMKETGFFPLEIQPNCVTDYRFTSFRYLSRKS